MRKLFGKKLPKRVAATASLPVIPEQEAARVSSKRVFKFMSPEGGQLSVQGCHHTFCTEIIALSKGGIFIFLYRIFLSLVPFQDTDS